MKAQKDCEEEMFDKALEYAAKEWEETFYAKYSDENNEDIQLPPELDEKIYEWIDRECGSEITTQEKPHYKRWTKKRRRWFGTAAAAIALCFICIWNVDAWRVQILNFKLEMTDNGMEIGFSGNDSNSSTEIPSDIMRPYYVPKGYQVSRVESKGTRTVIEYTKAKSDIIVYSIYESDKMRDSEYSASGKQDVSINGLDGIFINMGDKSAVIWEIDGYIYRIMGKTSNEELIKMAESVKL